MEIIFLFEVNLYAQANFENCSTSIFYIKTTFIYLILIYFSNNLIQNNYIIYVYQSNIFVFD